MARWEVKISSQRQHLPALRWRGIPAQDSVCHIPDGQPLASSTRAVLERYLARLVQLKQVPGALAVLRREIDRNPDDRPPMSAWRSFSPRTDSAEEEEVYRRAMQRFPDRSWYHKLARFYLLQKKERRIRKRTRK